MWKHLASLQAGMWINRVASEENIADEPSRQVAAVDPSRPYHDYFLHAREEYSLLRELGAERVDAVIDGVYMNANTWECLSLRSGQGHVMMCE